MRRLLAPAVLGLVLALLPARPVLARLPEAPVAPTPIPTPTPGGPTSLPRWYGWEVILLDGASIAIVEMGDRSYSTPLIVLGGVSYVALGPIVHAANGRRDRVVSSLLLRLAAPGVGVAAALVVHNACTKYGTWEMQTDAGFIRGSERWTCSIGEGKAFYAALYVPIVAVSLFDAIRAFRSPPQPIASPPASKARVEWLPTIAPTVVGAGATVGLVGAF